MQNNKMEGSMKKHVLMYSLAMALLITFLKLIEYQFIIKNRWIEIYSGIGALVFTILGIWVGLKLTRKKEVVIVKEVITKPDLPFKINKEELKRSGISKREYEILELIAGGLSNQEIADQLFVSLNTVKTHSSRLFEKLEVKRRTQAIQKAKSLMLIP